MRARTFVGIGSNIDHPVEHVRVAPLQLDELPSTRVVAVSSLYTSAPVGPQNQPDYVNAVAELSTALTPLALLRNLQRIERRHGRVRIQRWGRRTLDLDILLYGWRTLNQPRLQVPHPHMHLRPFVLVPLSEIDSGLIIPGKGKLTRLLAGLRSGNAFRIHRI